MTSCLLRTLFGRSLGVNTHPPNSILRVGGSFCRRQSSSSSSSSPDTYYDSQSGLHLPVHKEQEIRIFLNTAAASPKGDLSFTIPHHLYKSRDEAHHVEEQLESLTAKGIHGVMLPTFQFPRDHRNVTALCTLLPPGFFALYSQELDTCTPQQQPPSPKGKNCSLVVALAEDDVKDRLEQAFQMGIHTTLRIDEGIYRDNDAITVANNVASMIDAVGGACDFLWLSSSGDETAATDDQVVELCEELVYLDIAGPTIKSRILMDAVNNDAVEDAMFAGVNKFVVQQDDQVEMIESIAASQWKQIVK